MCGIVGIIGDKGSILKTKKMAEVQKHRGPDYTGFWNDEIAFLGHNRLSIIDLSENANQPFVDVSNRYQLVFNGEIYNYLELREKLAKFYSFKTDSDTEVLLTAYIHWGESCLQKLNGMFAFAIWDTKESNLFTARDRFGIKPFYYYYSENTLYFSSEIKGLLTQIANPKPNKKVWANYLTYGSYGMPNETFWKNIKQLPGGHILKYQKGKLKITKWYFFEEEIKKYNKKLPFQEVKEIYTELLKNSIALRFRADVPVGFNISGGLDSSALLSFVNKQKNNAKINAYTFYTDDDRYDELPWVEEMINLTKNPLHKVLFKANEVASFASKIASHEDEPFGGIPTLAYAKIFKKAKGNGTLVLLDGQGMDEQWAGYDYYVKNNDAIIQGTKSSPFKTNVLSDDLLKYAEKPQYPKLFKDELLNKQYRDLFYTKIPRALRFNDRVSMAFSTELRVPFLDYRLVEFAFAQPLEYKIKEGVQKFLLREIVSEDLSNSISYAPKRPLQTPQREWLGNELKEFVETALEKIENSEYANWFDLKELKKEWQEYTKGKNDSSFHIWQWLSLSLHIVK